ncbi:MAG: hypothetical protein NC452_09880 [Eubacterium sp.]|nr:hypothetical protein [Eubacterium sp.]
MSKKIQILGIVSAITLIIVGIFIPVPEKRISTYSFSDEGYYEYVGGDAYNIQIEASLRGGIIAGRTVAKAILISVGTLELFLVLAIYSVAYGINSNVISRGSEISSNDNTSNQEM